MRESDTNTSLNVLIRGICTSRLRMNILLSLENEPLSLSDLKHEVKADAPNTVSKAKELEELGLVLRNHGEYCLTPFGRIIRSKLIEFQDLLTTFNTNNLWWSTHNLEGIPLEFRNRLSVFSDAILVEDTKTEPEKAYTHKLNLMLKAKKRAEGIVMMYSNKCLDTVVNCLERELIIRLVIPPDIVKLMYNPDIIKKSKKMFSFSNLYMREANFEFSSLLIDDVLMLGLFDKVKKDHFDWSAMLFTKKPEAIEWGEQIFNYYWKHAKVVQF